VNRDKLKRYVAPVLITLGLGGAAAGGYVYWNKPAKAATGPAMPVRRGTLVETATASGKIEPDVQVEVKSRGSGQVLEVLVEEGDTVEPDQVLVKLDPTYAERDLQEAKVSRDKVRADLASASASVKQAELEAKNTKVSEEVASKSAQLGLGSTDAARTAQHATAVAESNITLKRAQLAASQASLKTADLAVANAENLLKEMTIYAPIKGTVLSVAVEKGTMVASALTNVSGGSAVMTVADLANLRIVGAIDQAQIGRVQVGQRVDIRVDAYADKVFAGVVDRVSPLGVETSSVVTFDVEIVIKDEKVGLLKSGMNADVEIVTSEQKDVLLVPLLAVQSRGRARYVRLQGGEERPVQIGSTDGTNMVVLEGLAEGDMVLTSSPAGSGSARPAGTGTQRSGGMGMGMGAPPGGGR
jgi:HlyD family secretion protein